MVVFLMKKIFFINHMAKSATVPTPRTGGEGVTSPTRGKDRRAHGFTYLCADDRASLEINCLTMPRRPDKLILSLAYPGVYYILNQFRIIYHLAQL